MLKEHHLKMLSELKGEDRKRYKELVYATAYGKTGALRDLALFTPDKEKVWMDCLTAMPMTPDQCYPNNYKLLLL